MHCLCDGRYASLFSGDLPIKLEFVVLYNVVSDYIRPTVVVLFSGTIFARGIKKIIYRVLTSICRILKNFDLMTKTANSG
jgi:hypothetical protein